MFKAKGHEPKKAMMLQKIPCYDFQLNRSQDQMTTLKTSNDLYQKQNEDLISKLKEVCV